MRMQVKTPKILGLVVIALSMLSLIGLAIPVTLMQTTTTSPRPQTTNSTAYQVLLAKAKVLNVTLSKCLALNISADLKSEIRKLLSVNISALSFVELRSWVSNASKLLSKVNEEVKIGGRAYAVGIVLERYLNGVRRALEERIKVLEKKHGVNITQILTNITRARDLKELNKALKSFEKDLWIPAKLKSFANASVDIAMLTALKGVKGVSDAYKDLEAAERALNTTIERLKKLNASKESIEALQLALDKVREAREIVFNVSKQLAVGYVSNVTQVIRSVVENRTKEVLEEIDELEDELQDLRNATVKENATKLVAAIDQALQKLEELKSRIANASVEDLAKWMPELAEIKAWIKMVEREIHRMPEWIPLSAVGNLYNKTIEIAMKLLSDVKEMLSYVKNSTQVVCIQVNIHPLPPICDKMYLQRIENMVSESEALVKKSQELYEQGNKIEAFITANRAVAMLQVAKAWLEPLYNMLKHREKTATKTVVTGLEIREVELQKIKGNEYALTIKVRNSGSINVTIERAILVTQTTVPLQIDIGVTVEPGKEITITKNITVPGGIMISKSKVTIVLQTSAGDLTANVEIS